MASPWNPHVFGWITGFSSPLEPMVSSVKNPCLPCPKPLKEMCNLGRSHCAEKTPRTWADWREQCWRNGYNPYPLVNVYIANWKITMLSMGKSTIYIYIYIYYTYIWPFSIAMLNYQRGTMWGPRSIVFSCLRKVAEFDWFYGRYNYS